MARNPTYKGFNMVFDGKQLDTIDERDLQSLVDNQVAEGKVLEYKEALPGSSDDNKKEFLFDVSSFANASGGHLIFGIKEEGGIAKEVYGLSIDNKDSEILCLENIIRDGIEPRIPGIQTYPILLQNSRTAIVIRIPRSWALPHMVTFKGSSKFYSRNSRGKYQLDVGEIRGLFLLSETTAKRIRDFRVERIMTINAGESPIRLVGSSKNVLHIIPLGAFDPSIKFDLSMVVDRHLPLVAPISSIKNYRYNFDGLLTYDSNDSSSAYLGYCQLFRSGIIESVDTYLLKSENNSNPYIPSVEYKKELLRVIQNYLSLQLQLGINPPVLVMLSLLGVTGYTLATNHLMLPVAGRNIIDRDNLLIPEVVLNDFNEDVGKAIKPVFDVIWQAAGWPES
ncbi:MAG: ATP-binding protein [candidate division Zixibacteria bacterium]|nr:ATP-binding protein [candidate division Zixibacteria bacterium]